MRDAFTCNSQTKFSRALRKYVPTLQVKQAVIYYGDSVEDLQNAEKEFIRIYDSQFSGYNTTEGGPGWSGTRHSDKTKAILKSKDYTGRLVACNEKLKELRKDPEWKAKVKESLKSRGPEWRAKISAAKLGKKQK